MSKLTSYTFSDIYLTPEGNVFTSDNETSHGLKQLKNVTDIEKFYYELENGYNFKNSSYAVVYDDVIFRVERIQTMTGIGYCARRMPKEPPDLMSLGLPEGFLRHLVSLNRKTGLIIWAGPTGMGKTTSISSLLCKFLQREGGFAYTIEDPPEMPLDGVYMSKRGGLGLCKQTSPIDGDWGGALKSALRSRPHYILVGEVRTSETASQLLRAATSGHLVLSTIHANSVEDAINSLVKYAVSQDMSEDLAYDLLSRGILGVVHQVLQGSKTMFPQVRFVFSNPDSTKGDQVRAIIKSGKINLGTTIESQMARMFNGEALYKDLS
ncbi:MAG: ATPase, T2SS/T4P/T4SS family [Alphaproteobacteria bacterium]